MKDDAISRAEAIRIASGYCHPSNIAKELAKLPSVLPKQKTGHWIEYTRVLIPEPFNKWEQAWYCSECGYGNQESDESAWLEWNYCPKCGAKMVEPQDSEVKE